MVNEAQAGIQRETLEVLGTLLRPGEPVALLDFPLHANAGDSLIYAGELAYLRRMGILPRYQANVGRYRPDDLRVLHPEGPILLHGGGNFGDRWPLFQAFRERVIADFPDRRIIQLPQSIEMSDATAARVTERYCAHPDLIVLLRDLRSMLLAKALLPGVQTVFCPDLAFGYEPAPPRDAKVDVLELRRTDSESAAGGPLVDRDAGFSTLTTDWRLNRIETMRWHALKAPGAVARRTRHLATAWYPTLIGPNYERIARVTLAAAERTIGRGRVVVTDRLHGAVLATLLGRPVVARDNANHKLSSIISDYLGRFASVTLAANRADATASVRAHLEQATGEGY